MTANPDSLDHLDPLSSIIGAIRNPSLEDEGAEWRVIPLAHLEAIVDEVKMLRQEILNLESDLEELEAELDDDGATCCRAQVTAGGGEHEPDCGAA